MPRFRSSSGNGTPSPPRPSDQDRRLAQPVLPVLDVDHPKPRLVHDAWPAGGAADPAWPRSPGPLPGAGDPPASLDDWLGLAVARILGADEAPRDPDGDIPIRSGSAMCYLRSIDDPPSVRLFSPMVVEVARTAALLEALNEINMSITVGRVFHTPENEVIFALELSSEQLTVDIIRASLASATVVADYFDHQIQSRFGGKTVFAETTDDSVMV